MNNVNIQKEKELFEFVPNHFYDVFEQVTFEWYELYCEWLGKSYPQVFLVSLLMADKGFVNEPDDVFYHEINLSWFIGMIIEEKYADELVDHPHNVDVTMLDLSFPERMSFEKDLKKMLDMYRMAYIDEDRKLWHCPIKEVW